jgi:DNA-binding CsgD family transcriptional regulator
MRSREVQEMDQQLSQLGRREEQIIELLLQGCDNAEIARDLNIAERTVKAHFNRLFVRFGIKDGIKRVKLATMLYRRQLWLESQQTAAEPADANRPSSNSSPRVARTGKLPIPSAPPSTSSRIISA